ncbi:MAG: flagellar type III secretion system protein FlhB [Proteobacteria bacterium]|nr:flagellar type III secretion system protein FlhB [Pseudomonadota bacterium]HQR05101.1 flagellar biosynthesis protein FlhB [Rhodocyclaceae bacterium]
MAEDSDLERTEPASSRRIEKAREEGQVPQSRELQAFLVLFVAVGGIWMMSGWMGQHATHIVREGLSFGRAGAFDARVMQATMASLGWSALLLAAPVFILTFFAAILAPAMLGGLVYSPKALNLNLSRLDPLAGVRRMFSVRSLGELVKAVLKALLIGGVITWVVLHDGASLFAMLQQTPEGGIHHFSTLVLRAAVALLAGLAFIAAIDVPFQLWQYYSGLRMTKEELRQEHKEMEGDPQLKARIRSQQREMARKRMMSEVPKANVVVTNPTHFAVALKYEQGAMAAPQVVAKGINLVAQKIRTLAEENQVPVLEIPPLARALYRHAEIGDQIPSSLYTAVAEVMAYVYQLDQFVADGGRTLQAPVLPAAVAMPDGMDPGAAE